MSERALQDVVGDLAAELAVPGVAVGVVSDGVEHYAYAGVTSIENPLAVDERTLFQFGSTGKTYTAAAVMRLVEQGRVDLDAPVRTYLPGFTLKDQDVAARVTVLQLLNHTAGWEGDMMDDTGPGDDALEQYVARMVKLEQASPLGATVSYNNAALSVAGRVIEVVTGRTYEKAIGELLLEPLGLTETFFFAADIISRRFAVGHKQDGTGAISVARPWAMARGNAPAGGMSATARDQIGWAKFHLGGGLAPDGTRLLRAETVQRMQEPTVDMRGSALGDHVGISWLLKDLDGARVVGHGGTTNGQHSEFAMVPARQFAVISMTNCGPNGPQFNDRLTAWAFEHYLGLVKKAPQGVRLAAAELAGYAGSFETLAASIEITPADGRLLAAVTIKPEAAAMLQEAGEPADTQPPFVLALLAGEADLFVVDEGPAQGMTGYFTRADDGAVNGVHLGGRLATRTAVPA